MAVEIDVKLDLVKNSKDSVATLGKNYENLMKELEDKIYSEMKLYWDGNRYNEFTQKVKIYMEALNNIGMMLNIKIPGELEIVFDAYNNNKTNNINFHS